MRPRSPRARDDVLANAPIVRELGEAIADCQLVIGTTARRRDVPMEEIDPREAAARIVAAAREGHEVALVFGHERTGLENDEIKRCHAAVLIPSDPEFPSLNLAQAVQVLAYEVRLALLAGTSPLPAQKADPPASSAELEVFFEHLAKTLDEIRFPQGPLADNGAAAAAGVFSCARNRRTRAAYPAWDSHRLRAHGAACARRVTLRTSRASSRTRHGSATAARPQRPRSRSTRR